MATTYGWRRSLRRLVSDVPRAWRELRDAARAVATARRRRHVPILAMLEVRDLPTIVILPTGVLVSPGVLPPNNRYVPVQVFGEVLSTRPETPTGFFKVTDEYRRLEPGGSMTLTPAGLLGTKLYVFSFHFTLTLQAQRLTNTPDGRHYDVLVGAKDPDNTGGRTTEVLVPKTYPSPPLPWPAAHPASQLLQGPRAKKAAKG